MKPSEILKCAVSHISKPSGWTKGAYARDPNREPCREDVGVAFCSLGAIRRCALYDDDDAADRIERIYRPAEDYLRQVVGDDVISWNDAESRRKPQVFAAFQKAIAGAEADEAATSAPPRPGAAGAPGYSFPGKATKVTPEIMRVYRSLEACGEVNGCGTAALAVMTGYPVEIVQDALRRCGRREGAGSRSDIFANAARLLGLKIRDVPAHEAIRLAKAGRPVFLYTHDHVFAASGGKLHEPNPWRYIAHLIGGIAVL